MFALTGEWQELLPLAGWRPGLAMSLLNTCYIDAARISAIDTRLREYPSSRARQRRLWTKRIRGADPRSIRSSVALAMSAPVPAPMTTEAIIDMSPKTNPARAPQTAPFLTRFDAWRTDSSEAGAASSWMITPRS